MSGRGWAQAATGAAALLMCVVFAWAWPAGNAGAAAPGTPLAYPGATYEGFVDSPVDNGWVVVGPTGSEVTFFDDGIRGGHCSDGVPYDTYYSLKVRAPIAINGVARFLSRWVKAYTPLRDGAIAYGRERQRLEFAFAGDTMSGVVEDRFAGSYRGRRVTCSVTSRRFVLYRDGTAHAPLSNAYAESGYYQGEEGGVYIHVPVSLASTVYVVVPLVCDHGEIPEKWEFGNLRIRHRGFSFAGRRRTRLRNGDTLDEEYVLIGQLGTYGSFYTAELTWLDYATVDDARGHRTNTCGAEQDFTTVGPPSPDPV